VTFSVYETNGNCTIPTTATGISTNVTIVSPSRGGFLTLFPGGSTRPKASNLNWVAGQAPTPNAVTVGLGRGGKVSVYTSGTVNVIIDIVGYYTAAGASGGSPLITQVVETGEMTLLPGEFVSGELFCPPGFAPVGTGVSNASIYTTTVIVGDFVGYFLANDDVVPYEFAEAQAVCLSGTTVSPLADGSAALEDSTSDLQEWQTIVEDLKAKHARANELRIQNGG
jgi:hypothetical protein